MTIIIKTVMRNAFEDIPVPEKDSPLFRKVLKHLKSRSGVIFRKQMWYVKRTNKSKRRSPSNK